jgi:molybdopterin-binding protein
VTPPLRRAILVAGDHHANQRTQPVGPEIIAMMPGAVNGTVKVDIGGGNVVTSSITKEAIEERGLAVDDAVMVIVKASDEMIGTYGTTDRRGLYLGKELAARVLRDARLERRARWRPRVAVSARPYRSLGRADRSAAPSSIVDELCASA